MRSQQKHRWFMAGLATLGLATVFACGAWVNADQSQSNPLANLTPQQQEAIQSANHLSSAFRTIANELLPSVVAIENRPKLAWTDDDRVNAQPSNDPFGGRNPFRGTPFEDMFRDFDFQNPPGARRGFPMPSPKAGIGSGVIMVFNQNVDLLQVLKTLAQFFVDETCGQCMTCRLGTNQIYTLLDRISGGEGSAHDLEKLDDLCQWMKRINLCGLGQSAPNTVITSLMYFRDEFESHVQSSPQAAG